MNKEEVMKEMYDIQTRYSKPLLKKNYTDKDYIIENYENLVLKITKSLIEKQQLQAKVNQLETNRDEAIEYIKNHIHQETYTGYMDAKELMKLVFLLERGEEDV